MATLGLDTGIHGGLAHLDDRGAIVGVFRMPLLPGGGIDWVRLGEFLSNWSRARQQESVRVHAAIEQVRAFAKKDPRGNPMVLGAVTVMLENSGRTKMLLEQASISYTAYYPQQWQASYRVKGARNQVSAGVENLGEGEKVAKANKANKLASLRIANGIWADAARRFGPSWTDGTAEAAMIGEHHRRAHR